MNRRERRARAATIVREDRRAVYRALQELERVGPGRTRRPWWRFVPWWSTSRGRAFRRLKRKLGVTS